MKTIFISVVLMSFFFLSCKKENNPDGDPPSSATGSVFIASDSVAKDVVLRSIPKKYIFLARKNLHIAYQHTSHGTHVAYGLFGLPGFKAGDDTLFAVTSNGTSVAGKLDFHDYAMPATSDLSSDETGFIQTTRNFLDASENANVNVVMWSWCSIAGHNVTGNYLPGMQTLINEYSAGGSKVGTGAGKRLNPVTFIFMTGHAEYDSNVGTGKPKNQAELILSYCKEHSYYCLDYYGIDTHDMSGNYWENAGDDGNSSTGGNFYTNWQSSHTKGVYWYENRNSPGGTVEYGNHNTQHITANRKAFAMWYILARIAGWDGVSSN
jgi:hypothetical protein